MKHYDALIEGNGPSFGEWQLCPKCNGEGEIYGSKGSYGSTNFFVGYFICPVCNGAKILARPLLTNVLNHEVSDTTGDAQRFEDENQKSIKEEGQ